MKASKKIERQLQARINSHKETLGASVRHDSKVQLRIDSGGYRMPGARSKKSR